MPNPAGADTSSTPEQTWVTNGRVKAVVHSGSRIYIAGYFTRPLEDGSTRYFGHVLLSLRKGADGQWRSTKAWVSAYRAVARVVGDVADFAERLDEVVGGIGVVFDDEQAHGRVLDSGGGEV